MTRDQLRQLEADLWSAADNLRANSDLKSNEYSTYRRGKSVQTTGTTFDHTHAPHTRTSALWFFLGEGRSNRRAVIRTVFGPDVT
jgi:hypothetical protein